MPTSKPTAPVKTSIRFAGAPRNSFPNRITLKSCLQETAMSMNFRKITLQYVFVDDEQLLKINQEYLGHDDYTDIITFNLSDKPSEIEGEIYISKDRVKENADGLNVALTDEFCRVMAHGLLHLCGLKDKTKAEKMAMRQAEDSFLKRYHASLAGN
jgi:rRNA maturation RNase YbeY